MSFYIDYQKMRGYYVDAEMWLASNMNALSNLSQRWTELAESEGMKGEGADAIRAYIREYHLSMINGLTVLLLQLYSKLLLYTDDYYTNIDADPGAMLIEDALNSYIDSIRNRMNMVDYFHEEAGIVLKSVSSMCNMDALGKVVFEEIGRGLVRRMEQLINDVTVLEENHAGDLDEPEEMLRSLNGMMSLFNWRPGKRMSGYSAGLVTGSTEFVVYAYAIQENMEDYEAQVEQIEIAQEHEEDRKIVEQRILGGVLQVFTGVGAVISGVCAILSTGGAATPFVVMAWFGAGGATLYGLSEIGEGIQSHALGMQRDTETETFNFERDVLCGGNQELYDTLGKISVELCDLADFGVDMTDLFGTLRRKGFGGRFGVNQLDDYAEHLTKGMDEVDDVVDAVTVSSSMDEIVGVVDDIPMNSQMDDVMEELVDDVPVGMQIDEVAEIPRYERRNSYPETNDVEELYERIYNQQYDVCEEYEDYLDELIKVQTQIDMDATGVGTNISVINRKGNEYPRIYIEGYGEVPFPQGPYTPNNSIIFRSQFTESYKRQFKEWWINQGRVWPNGDVNIHHIKPLSKGGDNSFENLVPLVQPEQHQPFTNWWRTYP